MSVSGYWTDYRDSGRPLGRLIDLPPAIYDLGGFAVTPD